MKNIYHHHIAPCTVYCKHNELLDITDDRRTWIFSLLLLLYWNTYVCFLDCSRGFTRSVRYVLCERHLKHTRFHSSKLQFGFWLLRKEKKKELLILWFHHMVILGVKKKKTFDLSIVHLTLFITSITSSPKISLNYSINRKINSKRHLENSLGNFNNSHNNPFSFGT